MLAIVVALCANLSQFRNVPTIIEGVDERTANHNNESIIYLYVCQCLSTNGRWEKGGSLADTWSI